MPTSPQSRSAEAASPPAWGESGTRHTQAVVIALLLMAAYWPILRGIVGSWFDEQVYMEHGLVVVPAAAYMVWTKRAMLAQMSPAPSALGLLLLLWGSAQAMLGIAAHWVWVSRMAFLVSLVGCILAFYGLRIVRVLAYPLGTLILMIAPPTFVYERLTLGLQLLASRLGEGLLEAVGYPVLREGNTLELVGVTLSIEDACSGIRSLLSIIFLCVLYDYLFVRGNRMRLVILAAAAPLAIAGNAGRLVATGIASQHNRALVQGARHEAFGYVSVVAAGIGCVLLHILMLRIQKFWRSRHA